MLFSIRTYGCQMNERDSDAVAALLRGNGFAPAAVEDDADLVIVNTCSVRGKAEDKALGKLGLLAASKNDRPGLRVGAIGCMVQRLGPAIFDRVPGLDFAVGPAALPRLPDILERVGAGMGPVLDTGEASPVLTGHGAGVCAFVTILLGCDRRCAYCIVPHVRGPERSRPPADVVAEVRRLAEAGAREVTLLGQSVMAYGVRQAVWPEGTASARGFTEALPRLLDEVCSVPGIMRVRFTSGHPSGCTAELARAMRELGPVCGHLHLPVQSGSDRILAAMGRGYTADGYRGAVTRLREAVPSISLTTDVIVGFPSETGAEFDETRSFMEEIGFDNAFIFKYSPRDGTPAAALEDDVPDSEKRRRNRVLLEDQERRGLRRNQRLVGRRVEVLVEGVSLRNSARWSGRTRGNRIVVFDPVPGMAPGDLVTVAVERAMPQTLYGQVAGPASGGCDEERQVV
jgi:tRNA-2-methylthio-N6-dimethylallyladenosine synthase